MIDTTSKTFEGSCFSMNTSIHLIKAIHNFKDIIKIINKIKTMKQKDILKTEYI